MAMTSDKPARSVSFLFVVLGLLAIAAGQVGMLVTTTRGVSEIADVATRKLLLRLAWLSLVLLCLTLVMLLWAVIRHVRYQMRSDLPVGQSGYVDAWALAGQRFQLKEGDDEEDDGQDDDDGREERGP